MDRNWTSRQMLARVASVGAVWGVSKLLRTPMGRETTGKLDRKLEKIQRKALKKTAKRARRGSKHPVLLTAGVAAFACGIALVTKATSK